MRSSVHHPSTFAECREINDECRKAQCVPGMTRLRWLRRHNCLFSTAAIPSTILPHTAYRTRATVDAWQRAVPPWMPGSVTCATVGAWQRAVPPWMPRSVRCATVGVGVWQRAVWSCGCLAACRVKLWMPGSVTCATVDAWQRAVCHCGWWQRAVCHCGCLTACRVPLWMPGRMQ